MKADVLCTLRGFGVRIPNIVRANLSCAMRNTDSRDKDGSIAKCRFRDHVGRANSAAEDVAIFS